MTSATAPVAAEIMAGRPPTKAMVTAIVNEANNPSRGSTPAMIEKEIASGIKAKATTSPARTSVRSRRGDRSAARTDISESSSRGCAAADVVDGIGSDQGEQGGADRRELDAPLRRLDESRTRDRGRSPRTLFARLYRHVRVDR